MFEYKMAVLWESGVYEGFLGYGRSEEDAKDDAVKRILMSFRTTKGGFKIIPPHEVYLLPKDTRDALKRDWTSTSYII